MSDDGRRGSDDGRGTGSSGNTGAGDGRDPPNYGGASAQFAAASAAAALLRGGVDGGGALHRRSFDSAFDGSAALLAGMSSLGLDQSRQPRISEGSTMALRGMPRNSTGSAFWMGNGNGGGAPGIAFGAGAQTANNAALQMLLNGQGSHVATAPGMVNPMNGMNGGYAHVRPQQFTPSPPQTPMSPGVAGFNAGQFGHNGGRNGVAANGSGNFEPPNAVAPQPPTAKPQWVPTVHQNGGVHQNGAAAKGPNAPGSPGPPRVSSFQHLGMIEGVLGDDQFYGA